MFAAHGRSGLGRRWFSEIEIRPTSGASSAIDSYVAPASPSSGPCTVWSTGVRTPAARAAAGIPEWSLTMSNSPARVSGECVAELRDRAADQRARRPCVDVGQLGLRQRVTRGAERDVVPGVEEPVGEQRDDERN